jgi:voltage-gated potassium channel
MEPVSERNNFIYLLVSLVVLLLAGALLDQFESALGHHLFQALTVITLASAIIGFRSSRLRFTTGIGFVLSTLVIVVLSVLLDLAGLNYLHLLILIVFYAWVTWLAAKQVLFSGEVDANKIVGAICIYLLMGLVWALMYLFIAQLVPGAFNGLEQIVWYENFANAAYYSFVTLTTLGYGDITPVAPVARFLVYMEAVFGVFYMAILVASLVGIGISTMNSNDE